MDFKNMKPADNYESLRIQFQALKSICQSQQVEVDFYRKKFKEFDFARIIQLEAELESQKEMNAILTNELCTD